jgi:hypothetical protein
MPVSWIVFAAIALSMLWARPAFASCGGPSPYVFPPGGDVLPNPTLYASHVRGITDWQGVPLAFVPVPSKGVKITAAEGTIFTVEVDGDPYYGVKTFGPYRVIAADDSDVPPVEVVKVDRFSEQGGPSAYAAVLTVPQAADAYEIEVEDLPGGALHTLVVPSRRAQLLGQAPAVPAYLDIGSIDCKINFRWESPKVRVRVAAVRTDGKKSKYSAPIVIRAPIPFNAGLLDRLVDQLEERPAPFAGVAAGFVVAFAALIFWVRSRASRSTGA